MYIFVQKGFYKGEVSTNLDGNITVNQATIVTDDGATRTVYIVDNKIYELNGCTTVASFYAVASVIKTISNTNAVKRFYKSSGTYYYEIGATSIA